MNINLLALSPNVPKADLRDYAWVVFGRPKAGKTSLFHAVIKEQYGGDMTKGLLAACESGYNALAGIVAQDIERFEDFQEMVRQLVENKEQMPFEMVGVDTVDKLWDYANDYIVRKKKREDGKPYKVIQDIPYGGGYELVAKEVDKQLQKLKRAGYGVWLLTHDKDKKFESRDGVSYDKTTVSLANRARDIILNMADFICFVDVAKEKDEDDDDRFVDARYIYFRSDNSDLEVGSRFKNVPNKIPYSAEGLIEVFKNAVTSEYEGDKSFEKIQKEQEKEREQRIERQLEDDTQAEAKDNIDIVAIIDEITTVASNLNKSGKSQVKDKFVEMFGSVSGYKKETDPDRLQEALDFVKSI